MMLRLTILRHLILRLLILMMVFTLSACSSYPGMVETPLVVDQQEAKVWSRVKFRLQWPEGEDLDFSYHLLIADQILLPVLESNKDDIPLWRFHRRAARDKAGHQFSFIYYSDSQTASKVQAQIDQNPIVSSLKDLDILKKLLFTRSNKDEATLIEFTSDPDWPLEIQQSWPYFIMGVSQSWLGLIEREHSGNQETPYVSIVEMLFYYQQLNDRIVDKWGKFGRHAYLHHLNAVYGYTPVYIRETGQWQGF
jgi:hypothetical protein